MTLNQKQLEEKLINNYLISNKVENNCWESLNPNNFKPDSEDFVKYHVAKYLTLNDYCILQIAYGKSHGTDILAIHKITKNILKIEAKGKSYHGADLVNLNTAIGEIVRDLKIGIKYKLAFPKNSSLTKYYLKDYEIFKDNFSSFGLDSFFCVDTMGNVELIK